MRRPAIGPHRARRGDAGFYAALPDFADFAEFTDPAHYRTAPGDWLVVVTDIEGSTRAIAEGRYKDVNMLAAAGIVAVLNTTGGAEIPFVFGGDGATLLVPPDVGIAVGGTLSSLARLARTGFDLTLRVGMVPVADLVRRGRAVNVARFAISPGSHLALFAGGGVELAAALIKGAGQDGAAYRLPEAEDTEGLDLSGLSCRWEPLPARNGVMLSLLAQAAGTETDGGAAAYRAVMEGVVDIIGSAPDAGNPVSDASLTYRWPPSGLRLEAQTLTAGHPIWPIRLRLHAESLLQWIALRLNLSFGAFEVKRYRSELRLNADYRRFDDTLRLVVDCAPSQADRIERFLQERRDADGIAFGTHRSDSALMTCLVFSLQSNGHLHFIDGSGGGFTLASRQLKAQLAEGRVAGAG
jgi:hypothetical protein